jgi:hypothetical protein
MSIREQAEAAYAAAIAQKQEDIRKHREYMRLLHSETFIKNLITIGVGHITYEDIEWVDDRPHYTTEGLTFRLYTALDHAQGLEMRDTRRQYDRWAYVKTLADIGLKMVHAAEAEEINDQRR